jgi:hypothetical protein
VRNVVDIELQLRFGGAKITLPDDAVVDLDDCGCPALGARYARRRRASCRRFTAISRSFSVIRDGTSFGIDITRSR